jgi:two-component system LytT family sensor kinase
LKIENPAGALHHFSTNDHIRSTNSRFQLFGGYSLKYPIKNIKFILQVTWFYTNFAAMKRFLLNVLFWLCFFTEYGYIGFTWDSATFPNWTIGHVLATSLPASLVFLIPQMLFAYYMVYIGVDNIIKKKRRLFVSIIEIVAVLFLCILLHRCISVYINIPFIYKAPQFRKPLLEIRHVFTAIMDIGFAFFVLFSVESVRKQLAAKEREKNLIKEKLETELKFLKAQTNPHFLLNTLNNIYALSRKKSDHTPEVVMRLSELLRFMLFESKSSRIKLSDEINVLENYLELETIRYNQRLAVSIEKTIDCDSYCITPFLLLPFLENAFKHGISETRFESYLHINISAENNLLHFKIENSKDNGEQEKPATKTGLMNVKRQLELTYSDYKLVVQNNLDAFKVDLTINLNSYVEI